MADRSELSPMAKASRDAEPFQLDNEVRGSVSNFELYGKAISHIPDASVELFNEAVKSPWQTAGHIVSETVFAAGTGAAIGYVVPAKGPAAMIVAGVFTVPLAYDAVKRLYQASGDLQTHSSDEVAKALAKDTLSGAGNLALNLVGGYAGTEFGARLARRNGMWGDTAQVAQRNVERIENEALLMPSRLMARSAGRVELTDTPPPTGPNGIVGRTEILDRAFADTPIPTVDRTTTFSMWKQPTEALRNRLNQYSFVAQGEPTVTVTGAMPPGLQMYFGSTHGHSRYSDGMGLPIDLYKKAISEGQDVTTITDHNHLAARNGIKDGDPRAKDQAGTPTVAETPVHYSQTQIDAMATTIPGKHVSLFGIEIGTIGSATPHVHDGRGGHSHGEKAETPKTKKPKKLEQTTFELVDGAIGEETVGAVPIVEKPGPTLIVEPESFTTIATSNLGKHKGEVPAETPGATTENSASTTETRATEKPPAANTDTVDKPHDHPDVAGTTDTERLFPYDFHLARLESLEADHLSGVNHVGLLETPTFYETIRTPRRGLDAFVNGLRGKPDKVTEPEIEKIADGNLKLLFEKLETKLDTEGKPAIMTFNHPRFLADVAAGGRDYGRKSFKDDTEWLKPVVKHVRGIELIKGGALTPHPVDKVPTGAIDLRSYTGYLGLGVEAGPLFGRDFHFGDPVGNPGSTGFLAAGLDRYNILESLRERRFMATTNKALLSGHMIANDKFPMGSILDQSAVPDITLKMRIAGEIDPQAKYTVELYRDEKVLDGTDATVFKTKEMTGQELLANNNEVAFDPIKHKLGNNTLYFMEVTRRADGEKERLFTSPIWVRPLNSGNHGLLARLSAGSLSQWVPQPFATSTTP